MVVTDIKLPGQRDSIDVTVAARRVHPGIPVLFIAGLHWRLADAKTLGGPAAFLWRPFSLTALVRDLDGPPDGGRRSERVGQEANVLNLFNGCVYLPAGCRRGGGPKPPVIRAPRVALSLNPYQQVTGNIGAGNRRVEMPACPSPAPCAEPLKHHVNGFVILGFNIGL